MDDANIWGTFETEHKTAFGGKVESYRINLSQIDMNNMKDDLDTVYNRLANILANRLFKLDDNNKIKATLNLQGSRNEYDYTSFAFNATLILRLKEEKVDINEYVTQRLNNAKNKIKRKYDDYDKKNGGGKHLTYLYLHIYKIDIDIKIDDDMSFKESVLEALPDMNPDEIVMDGIDHPVQLDDILHIEEMNKFSINVYMLKDDSASNSKEIAGPVYYTKHRKEKHVNLLLRRDNIKEAKDARLGNEDPFLRAR